MLRINDKGILVPTVKGCLSIAIHMAKRSDGISADEVWMYFKKELEKNGYKIISKEKFERLSRMP